MGISDFDRAGTGLKHRASRTGGTVIFSERATMNCQTARGDEDCPAGAARVANEFDIRYCQATGTGLEHGSAGQPGAAPVHERHLAQREGPAGRCVKDSIGADPIDDRLAGAGTDDLHLVKNIEIARRRSVLCSAQERQAEDACRQMDNVWARQGIGLHDCSSQGAGAGRSCAGTVARRGINRISRVIHKKISSVRRHGEKTQYSDSQASHKRILSLRAGVIEHDPHSKRSIAGVFGRAPTA